jgi:c-di-GMP-binding flagellar brake protein YcgR
MSLIPVQASDLTLGKPLQRPLYDWHGKLLHSAGSVLSSQEEIDALLKNGFVQDSGWDLVPSAEPAPAAAMQAAPVAQVEPLAAETATDVASAKEVIIGLDDVRWFVGETLHLQQIDNSSIRYSVRLIGYVKNKTVFVTAPAVDGKFEFIRDGQMFVVRAFSGKKAYAFIAAAVKSAHSPHPYLHLSYPKEVRCTVVRRGARAQVRIIAAISIGNPEKLGAGTLTDLSMGGASATMKQPFGAKGDACRVKFKVHAAGQDEYLNLSAVLRSIVPSENGDGYKHGLEFLDVSIHDRLILSAFVHQTLAEGE